MKKALVFALLLALVAGLGACGRTEETTSTTLTTLSTATTATTATVTTTSLAQTTTTAVPQEPVSLKCATTFRQTDAGGKIVQRFCDYIEDATAGVVSFDIYFDGILGNVMEELGLVRSGSADMILLDPTVYASQVPLLNCPKWAPGTAQAAVDYFNNLVVENLGTAPLIQAEAAANNMVYLGLISGGGNVFLSASPFEALSDLEGRKFGATWLPAFEALGYSVVESLPSDTYENLSQGVIDATWMAFRPALDPKLYEVAKYYMWDGTCTAGSTLAVNLRTWAELTPETQRIFREAAKDAEAFSLELDAVDTETNLQVLADAGATVGSLTPDDAKAWFQALFEACAADCMARAQNLGIVDNMVTVLKIAATSAGVTWAPPTP